MQTSLNTHLILTQDFYQSFERVLKVPQDDILGLTKGVAMFDPSPNSQAIDDYVNRVIDDTKKTER